MSLLRKNEELSYMEDIIKCIEIKCKENDVENSMIQYCSNSIRHRLKWYIENSYIHKRFYLFMAIISILISSSIPIINQFANDTNYNDIFLVTSILSAIISIIASIIALCNFQETWYRYRKNTEKIKKEITFFLCSHEKYKKNNKNFIEVLEIFLSEIERICEEELNQWSKIFSKEKSYKRQIIHTNKNIDMEQQDNK